MGIGMCSSKRLVHQPGLKPASGKYATRATDTDFDNKTNITVLQFLYSDQVDNVRGLNPSSATTFSLWDGADGVHTFWTGNTNNKELYMLGKGTAGYNLTTGSGLATGGYNWADDDVTGQRDGICSVCAYTHDASLSEDDT